MYDVFAKCPMNMHGHCFDFGWSFVQFYFFASPHSLTENVSILKLIVLLLSMERLCRFLMGWTWICTNVHLQMNIFCTFFPFLFLANDRWMAMPLKDCNTWFLFPLISNASLMFWHTLEHISASSSSSTSFLCQRLSSHTDKHTFKIERCHSI